MVSVRNTDKEYEYDSSSQKILHFLTVGSV